MNAAVASPPTVLSCFSGAGGLDLGLESAGFENIGCLETDEAARATLAANRPDWTLLAPSDVVQAGRQLKPRKLGLKRKELTLLAGGPPCQSFSKAAQWASPKKGIQDDRGKTVTGMMGLVEAFLPAAVMIENVEGFVSGSNNALEFIRGALKEINRAHKTKYTAVSWVVDAADFGVPQHRRRAIVLAFRECAPEGLNLPTTHESALRTAWDALGGDEPDLVPVLQGKYATLLPCIPEGGNYQYLTARGAGPAHELFGYRTRYWSFLLKLARDKPAWTIPASPGPSTGPFHWNDRPLTNAERLLLQGFPIEWKLVGNDRETVKLAGNATPPPLADAVGRLVLSVLFRPSSPIKPSDIESGMVIPRRDAPPSPTPPAELPDQWMKLVGPRGAHPGSGRGPAAHAIDKDTTPASG